MWQVNRLSVVLMLILVWSLTSMYYQKKQIPDQVPNDTKIKKPAAYISNQSELLSRDSPRAKALLEKLKGRVLYLQDDSHCYAMLISYVENKGYKLQAFTQIDCKEYR